MTLLMAARHLLAILLLPFMVVVVIPRWIIRAWAMSDTRWQPGFAATTAHVAGAVIFLTGFAFFAWCIGLFARVGKGTLAPWDPTRRLVVTGPYRYVRNPMISGVLMIIAGEALFHGSTSLGLWMLTFFLFNQIHFLVYEEPNLESRFGDEYRTYKAGVRRWIPRLSAWTGH